jgi:hypothetical protein
MTKAACFLFVIVCTLAASAAAQDGSFGLGVMVGEPTGINGKLWLSDGMAVDGGVAWSFGTHDRFHLHFDYLFHSFTAVDVERGQMPIYYGVGGRIQFRDDRRDLDDEIGVRIPLGFAYLFESAPVDLFFEIVPIVDLAPDTELDWNAVFGVRYFFGGSTGE